MDKTESLLRQLKEVLLKQKTINHERQRHGENFNIFKILGLSYNETRLHSAFIAELLSPEGSHGLGNRFLGSFLKLVVKDLELDINNAKVTVEKFIGYINADSTQGGRIDLLIEDNKGKAVIIENKIDAEDQENQLLRYHNYGHDTYKDFRLLYLTKDGNLPSEFSTNREKFDYRCISYRTQIMGWLNSCVEIAARQPLVRETIQQYILNIKDILGMMDENTTTRMVDIATSKENVETTLSLLENASVIYTRIRLDFIESLIELGKGLGYSDIMGDNRSMAELTKENQWLVFTLPNISTEWGFRVGWTSHNSYDGARYGISRLKKDIGECITEAQLEKLPHIYNEGNKDAEWPLGWIYFYGDDGNRKGTWWRWDNPHTLRDMTNGKFLKFIRAQLIKVRDEELIEKVVKITSV